MSIEETTNAISSLISKFIGKNNWIFLFAVASASAAGIYYHNRSYDVWWLVSIFVFCSTMLILNALTYICDYIYKSVRFRIQKRKDLIAYQKQQEQRMYNSIQAEKKRIEELGEYLWPYVEYENIEYIDYACAILELPMSNKNKYIRFLRHPKENYGKEYEYYKAISQLVGVFQYHDNLRACTVRFLDISVQKHGCLIEINEYFYLLLENYIKTKKWERVY